MNRLCLTVIWTITATMICSAQTVFYLPQIAVGTQPGGIEWGTAIVITNPAPLGTVTASGTVTLTKSDGTPLNVPFFDLPSEIAITGNTIPFQIAGGQTKFFSLEGGSLNVGYATVTSNLPVAGGAAFFEHGPNGLIAEAGVASATPVTKQTLFVVEEESHVGVAIANPGASTATITFQLLDTNGVAVAPDVTRTLAAKNHTAFFVEQLFPNRPAEVYGTLRITSGDSPLVATALIFEPRGQFATLPVVPLQ